MISPYFGAEYIFYKGIFIDARFNLNTSNFLKESNDEGSLKNNFVLLGVGYRF